MPDRPITAADTGPAGSRTVLGHPWQVLAAISAGGVLGALARAALGERFGTPQGGFAWTTFAINVSGCLLIGALMVLVTRSRNGTRNGTRLLRPFLGVGVLGGFTTFSGYVVDTEQTLAAGAVAPALGYLLATPVAAVLAAYLGARFTRWAIRPRPSPGPSPGPSRAAGR